MRSFWFLVGLLGFCLAVFSSFSLYGCALNDRQVQDLVLMNDIVQRREDGIRRSVPASVSCNPNIFGGYTCQ